MFANFKFRAKNIIIIWLVFICVNLNNSSSSSTTERNVERYGNGIPSITDEYYYRDPRVLIPPIRDPRFYSECIWVSNRTCPDPDVKIYLYTRDNPTERQIIHIGDTWETSNLSESNFNPFIANKIIIHGYNSDMFLNPLIQMKDEYLDKSDYNLFYIDWSVLARGPCYVWAVNNLKHAGTCVADLVNRLLDVGIDDIHLIGFSLGAQLANFVAQNLPAGTKLKRITGLDPAMPLFISSGPANKLDPTDAEFVDVIHTNALIQGKIERCGHVDFYMNGGIMQPGCFQANDNPFACSHHRAPDYFAESIRSERGFWGWSCPSYISYLLGMCPPNNYLVIAGEDCASDTNQGMYMIKTGDMQPFALGKWTDLSQPHLTKTSPFVRRDPFLDIIDDYGKIDGGFNHQRNTVRRQQNFPLVKHFVAQLRNVTSNTITRQEKGRQQFAASWRTQFYNTAGKITRTTTTRRPSKYTQKSLNSTRNFTSAINHKKNVEVLTLNVTETN